MGCCHSKHCCMAGKEKKTSHRHSITSRPCCPTVTKEGAEEMNFLFPPMPTTTTILHLSSNNSISSSHSLSTTSKAPTQRPSLSFGTTSLVSTNVTGPQETYTIVRKLGQGQYGHVHLGVQNTSGRLCAIKEWIRDTLINNESAMMITKEIEHLQRCAGHSCIVQLHDVLGYTHEETTAKTLHVPVCVVTEYLNGDAWGHSDFLSRKGPISCDSKSLCVVRGILRDVLTALHHMHDIVGIAHMDIKPENIIVLNHEDCDDEVHYSSPQGTFAKVIDLGSAISVGGELASTTSNTAGTHYYCSPEKIISRPYHTEYCPKKADIWALGITTAVAIYGDAEVPYSCPASKRGFVRTVLTSPPHLPNSPHLHIPSDLLDLIHCMLRRDPKERPTALELLGHKAFSGFQGSPEKRVNT
eukprot:PhF_6_TR25168/c0_g1_i1/m.34691